MCQPGLSSRKILWIPYLGGDTKTMRKLRNDNENRYEKSQTKYSKNDCTKEKIYKTRIISRRTIILLNYGDRKKKISK